MFGYLIFIYNPQGEPQSNGCYRVYFSAEGWTARTATMAEIKALFKEEARDSPSDFWERKLSEGWCVFAQELTMQTQLPVIDPFLTGCSPRLVPCMKRGAGNVSS